MVRCGNCGRTINALSSLFDRPPAGDDTPIEASGMPPLLNPDVEQERILEVDEERTGRDDTPVLEPDFSPDPSPPWMRGIWIGVAVLLVALLGVQLFGPESVRLDAGTLGFGEAPPAAMDEAIQLVSRDMHPHPTLDDSVIVSAVLVNRADRTVPWPNIVLKLFDASQQVVGERRLAPSDYLDPSADLDAGFAPDVRLPVVLEMVVEASDPVGFSMAFY